MLNHHFVRNLQPSQKSVSYGV